MIPSHIPVHPFVPPLHMMTSSPMSNIDDDCLLMIFDIITRPMPHPQAIYLRGIDEDRERPLNTIRTASQVCRRWRGSLISSPWIWGRVIDLDIVCLGGERFDWLAEVLRRAGSETLLWITGNIFNTSTQPTRTAKGSRLWSTEKAFIYLLNSWERIEKLDVVIQVIGNTIPENIQNRFISRAPNLKMFSVAVVSVYNTAGHNIVSQPEPSQNLFANYAPLLRTIRIRTGLINFKLDASWLSNITQMVPIPRQFNLNEVFVLLHRAPMLENIELVDPVVPPSDYLTLPIHLPNLTSINFIANLEASARFLDLLRPGRLSFCWIKIPVNTTAHSGEILPTTVIPAFKKSVPKLIFNYFSANAQASTSVEITVDHSCFAFSAMRPHRNGHPQFFLRLYGQSQLTGVLEEVKSCLIEALAIAPSIEGRGNVELFRSVNELTLSLQNLREPSTVSNSVLGVFQRIQHLTIHEYGGQTICTISRLDQMGNILFPELHTLSLIPGGSRLSENDARYQSVDIEGFTEFFVERKRQGFPVRRLDLTAKGQYHYTPDFRELEQVDGLEVLWLEKDDLEGRQLGLTGHPEAQHGFSVGDGEGSSDPRRRRTYICGSGDPEQLKDILDIFMPGDIDFERDFGCWFSSIPPEE